MTTYDPEDQAERPQLSNSALAKTLVGPCSPPATTTSPF